MSQRQDQMKKRQEIEKRKWRQVVKSIQADKKNGTLDIRIKSHVTCDLNIETSSTP